MFESIFGNDTIKAYLERALLEKRLPQTLLFSGPEGVGKSLFAKEIAAYLLQSLNSPDLHILKPEGKSGLYAIDTLREMIEKEHAAAYQSSGKVFILEDVERMQPAAANALLKTLEEPTPDTTFILLCSSTQEILLTILSRCTILHFHPIAEELIVAFLNKKQLPTHFAKKGQGSIGKALELAERPDLEEQRKILFRLLAQKPSYPEMALQLDKIENLLKEEENPLFLHRRVEYLFSYILMWHRDQHARALGVEERLLFFPEEPACSPIPLTKAEKAIEKARFAYMRNMKLSLCLKTAILK
jgi:DNA polymerase-3 subunit delta'